MSGHGPTGCRYSAGTRGPGNDHSQIDTTAVLYPSRYSQLYLDSVVVGTALGRKQVQD